VLALGGEAGRQKADHMAPVDQNKKIIRIGKKRRFWKVIVSVIVLAGLSFLAAMLITGKGKLTLDGVRRLLDASGTTSKTDGFSFESGFNNVFVDMDGGFAVASTVGVQVFNGDGKKAYTEVYEMANPTICASGKICTAYDLGGRALKVFDTTGILGTMKTEGSIVSASLSKSGSLVVCTQASGGYKSRVSFYKSGEYDFAKQATFYWDSGQGYILSATVSPDDKRLAVLTLTDKGSRIVFFSLDSTDEKGSCTLTGRLALDIRYTEDGRVIAVCKDALVSAAVNGSVQVILEYPDKYLEAYSGSGAGFTALFLSDYMVGDQGRIVTVGDDGKKLGTLETQRKLLSVSARGGLLAVLYGDGVAVYDRNLKETASNNDTAGALGTIMRSDGTALLIAPHSATVFSTTQG
jgi:WD40 repeat protein